MIPFPKHMDLTPPKYKKDKILYTPIHIHSSFSTYDSCSPIKEIVEVVSQLGMKAVSLSDHGNMSGVYSFVQKCKELSIKPIVGCEFYVNENRFAEKRDTKNWHLCLFAMNLKGYKNLLKILYDALTEGFYYRGRTDLDFIAENSDGLICTTACIASPLIRPMLDGNKKLAIRNLKKLKDIFGDRLYIEFQFNELEEQKQAHEWLMFLVKRFNIKGIYGLDSHYTYPKDNYVQDFLKLNRRKITIYNPKWEETIFSVRSLFIKPYQVAFQEPFNFGFNTTKKFVREILNNTNEIADRVDFDLEFGLHAPTYKYKGKSVNAPRFLKLLLEKGFIKKLKEGAIPKSEEKLYRDRMNYEYQKILDCGYPNYFLLIWDMVRESIKRGIYRGIGRGSASGSLVSFVLDINGVDPIKHGLLFERFMDIERKDPPDIDLDWESDRRNEVEDYLREKYGEDRVARVATFSYWGTKSALGEVLKTLGEDIEEVKQLSKWIRLDEGDNRDDKELREALRFVREECTDRRVIKLLDKHEDFGIQIAKRLIGNVRNVGLHPGGAVVSPKPIFNYIPVVRHKNMIITGFSQGSDGRTELEDIGLIKIDNLGVNAVSTVKETIRLIKERRNEDLSKKIWNLDLEDSKIYDYYQRGYTEGIFQVESEEINRFIQKLIPESFEDLRAIVALYRPGALASGEAERFIKRKHGKEEVVYVHPILKKYIGTTHACFVYQEQMMSIMHELAGFTRGEVLKCMKLLKKSYDTEDKRVLEVVERLRKGLIKLSNFSKEQAEVLTETMRKCYAYIFNKSHSTAYALFSYQMMWLKRYYPLEFFCALLSRTENKKTEHKGGRVKLKLKHYIDGAAKLGIEVLPPKFGYSKARFEIEGDNIRCGNNIIVGIGKSASELEKVEDDSYFENLICNSDISWSRLNKSKVDRLIKLGFFDGTVKLNRNITRKQLSFAWLEFKAQKKKPKPEEIAKSFQEHLRKAHEEIDGEYSQIELAQFQIEGYRFFFSIHPVNSKSLLSAVWFYNRSTSKNTLKIKSVSALNKSSLKKGTMFGYITNVRVTTPKTGFSAGEPMAIVTIEDSKDKAKILVWPEYYAVQKYRKVLKEGEIVIARLKRKRNDDDNKTWELFSNTDTAHLISEKDLYRLISDRRKSRKV